MNLYLQNAGIYENIKRTIKCVKRYKDDIFIIHIFAEGKPVLPTLLTLIHLKPIIDIYVHTDEKRLSFLTAGIIKKSKKVNLHLIIKNYINLKDWEKITTIHKLVLFEDSTGLNDEWYSKYRYAVVDGKDNLESYKYGMLQILSGKEPTLCCECTSCLGENIYIKKNGDMFFCPKHTEESAIGKFDVFSDPFEHHNFISVLTKEIEKRNKCKTECQYFYECKGACPLDDKCQTFKRISKETVNFISSYDLEGKDLSELKFFEEKGLMEYFSSEMVGRIKDWI